MKSNLQKMVLLVDADNTQLSKLEAVIEEVSLHGRIIVKRAYGNWKKDTLKNWETELKRLTLALCKPEANHAARIAAIQLAGERGYAEALPVLRETLLGARRDAVLDIVCIGSVGLLGNADDIPILSRLSSDSRRAAAVDAAIR